MRRTLLVLLLLVFSSSLVGCGDDGEGAGNSAVASRDWLPDGTWIRDRQGHVLLLRGSNYSGLEWGYFSNQPHGPEEADFAQMASWGVAVVRLPIAWTYLEPEPNRLDLDYLRTEVDRVIGFAQRHGMVVILDMHQFNWSSCFNGGLGVPPWTCKGKYPAGLVGQFHAETDFWRGITAPDGRPLIEHFVDVWRAVATYYRDSPTVVAFDFFNEPLDPGDLRIKPPDQVAMEFEHNTLFPFYRRLALLVRSVGARQTLVLEPAVTRNLGYRAHPEPIGDSNVIYSPHIYLGADSGGYHGAQSGVSEQYAQAVTEAAEMQAPLWVGEWGGNDPKFYGYSLFAEDQFLIGGAVWGYFPSGNELVDAAGNENPALVNLVARPYPIQTAGIPQSLHWDVEASVLDYTWTEDPARTIPNPTILFIPAARHFANGVQVTATAGDDVEIQGDRLIINASRSNTQHSVHVAARP
ncbi:MAG: cellulase family glycosylhydrolase [Deltaproteobacteria bacterium]|nr:cellulase family glycosylhydrolase [Deltaproteobacteria bacterium]